ncbi:CaiB/BaiF CoA-transferase family protein [Sphingomonas glacialis]|nr:CoA transferase [Sphingomonas glacialis]
MTDTIRVVELASLDIPAAYAGWLLAAMGATVTRVGDLPAAGDDSLALAAASLAQGKTLVPRDSLEAVLESADVLLCDDREALVLAVGGLDVLIARYPRLVIGVHSIFGLDGPYADIPATALDAQALSGVAWALGEPDRAPLSIPAGILEHQGGAVLAAGTLAALTARERDGLGQVVDVALADVLASYVGGNSRFYIHHGMAWHRNGRRASSSGGAYPFAILPCADGEVCLCGRSRDEWNRLVTVMGNPAWAADPRYQSLRAMGRDYPDEVDALVKPWLAQHDMAELERLAIANNLIMSPVRSIADVIATPGFHADGFLHDQDVAGRKLTLPGLPFRATAARRDGERDLASGLLATDAPPASTGPANRPLAGMRVIDFGWVWSAPWVGTMLGELGAEVIKIEHGKRPDTLRLSGKIFRDGVLVEGSSTQMSPMYHQVNHGKLGVTLNAKEPRAVELIRELIATSDLVIENMSPGSLERSGLGYELFRSVNPRIVMLAMSAAGQFGVLAGMRAYAPTMSSFAGLEALVGYPDEAPIGALNVGLGDPNASVHGLLTALAALRRARATGEGCYIDLSQVEALAGTLRPQIVATQIKGEQPTPTGNRHPHIAPHGIYPASGEDRWLTLAAVNESAWCSLATMVGLASDKRFGDRASRLANVAELDAAMAAWTVTQERDDLVARLRAIGIAATPVLSIDEMWRDPHFSARGVKHPVDIPGYGTEEVFRGPWRFSRMAPVIDRRGPLPGEHNTQVFGGLLGLSDTTIAELSAAGVIA